MKKISFIKHILLASLLLLIITIARGEQLSQERSTISVYIKDQAPSISFAMEDFRNNLKECGYKVENSDLQRCDIAFLLHSSEPDFIEMKKAIRNYDFIIKPEGFSIHRDANNKVWVAGGDSPGLMYGILELTEQVKLNGLKGIRETDRNPYMEKRGIKFNIPLDARTPSYSDMSDAGQENIPEMWNFGFWKETIDNLARNRYNFISLWSLHPFPSLVKVPEYPDIALDDVRRSKTKFAEYYSTRATDIYTTEITANTETVLKIPMDEKIEFWRKVMKYAADRNIGFYILTWNIYPSGIDGKYGITDDISNQTTRDYYRKSVKEMFLTYPDLEGIGVTTGENMGKGGEGFEAREDWICDTYVKGILDVLEVQPDRKITFIHRQHEAGTKYIIQRFTPMKENKNLEILFSFKYAQAHVFSSVKQSYHKPFIKEIPGWKTLWTLRNDDNYYFRWGAPDFVREFIKNIPQDVSAGFYYGSDNYIWGKDFLSLNPGNIYQTETGRQWYQWMIWGRLGYDPDMNNERFIKIIADRFPEVDAGKLFNAWQNASMVYPITTGFHWGDLDYKWYIEGCKSRPEPAQTASGFHDIDRFITLAPHKESGYQSIPDYVTSVINKKSTALLSPIEVSKILHKLADSSLTILRSANGGSNKELICILNDIQSMDYLGKYYAFKISAAANLAMFRETKDISTKNNAVSDLTEALEYWKLYTGSAMKQYRNPLWTNRVGYVDWIKLTDEVKNDIEIVKTAK